MRRMYSQNQLLETVKDNITADDIQADNAQSVQENLERIDERIDDVDVETLFNELIESRGGIETSEEQQPVLVYSNVDSKWHIEFRH